MAQPSSSSFTTPWVTYPQIDPNYHMISITNYMYGMPKNEVYSSTWNPGKWHKLNTAQNRHCMVLTMSPPPRGTAAAGTLTHRDSLCQHPHPYYWFYLFRHDLQTSKFQIPYLKSFFPLGWQTWVSPISCQHLSQLQCFFCLGLKKYQ